MKTQKQLSTPIYLVVREDNETKETEILSLLRAKQTLSNYFKKECIEEMLDKGQTLHTPYATYSKEIIGFSQQPITIS